MKSKIVWKGNHAFSGTGATSPTEVVLDASKSAGGDDTGPSPMEYFLMSLAGCASIDIIMILQKRRKELTDYWVEVTGERRDELPKYFESIHLNFHFVSDEVTEKEVARAIQLSEDKYCSVWNNIDLSKTKITYDYVIHRGEKA